MAEEKKKKPVLSKSTDRWERWLALAFAISMITSVIGIIAAYAKAGAYGA